MFIRILCGLAVGQHARTTIKTADGVKDVPNYALIQGVFIGCVSVYIIVLALIGPENHGSHFERGKTAFQADVSKEDVNSTPGENDVVHNLEGLRAGSREKEVIQLVEIKGLSKDSFV